MQAFTKYLWNVFLSFLRDLSAFGFTHSDVVTVFPSKKVLASPGPKVPAYAYESWCDKAV